MEQKTLITSDFYFFQVIPKLSLNKRYFLYSIMFGVSTLVLPLTTQFLVNNLALAAIWLNTIVFVLLVALGLVFTKVINHSQLILSEYMQRELFVLILKEKIKKFQASNSYYYFEFHNLIKSYSKAFTSIIETCLILFFGLLVIISFHPFFFFLALFLIGVLVYFYKIAPRAVKTSIKESDEKYQIYFSLAEKSVISDELVNNYLNARNDHFFYLRSHSKLISVTYIVTHLYLLLSGIYLIQNDQLSVGQLVAAEIILTGILASLLKFPHTLEFIYDLETSYYKINKATSGESK